MPAWVEADTRRAGAQGVINGFADCTVRPDLVANRDRFANSVSEQNT